MSNPKILIFASYYLPGFKAGGAIRSIANLVARMGKEYEFHVVSRDRDAGDMHPYKQATAQDWILLGHGKIRYLSKREACFSKFLTIIRNALPDLLYFNSFFDPDFTIKPLLLRRLGLLPSQIKIVIAPRGEFAQGALALKPVRKRLFILGSKWFGLYRNLIWQASSEFEAQDIRRWLGSEVNVHVASDMTLDGWSTARQKADKTVGVLRAVCVARVARNKNIHGALQILKEVQGQIEFHLYGPNEDESYWNECLQVATQLPKNVVFVYHGQIPHDQVQQEMLQYDLFFLPTEGENFCHAILEALHCGLPLLISDRTPWRDLETKGIGWDIPLSQTNEYCRILNECTDMGSAEFEVLSKNAKEYGLRFAQDGGALQATRALFTCALGR